MLHHRIRSASNNNTDPYFNYTTLLLSGEGSNGGQNNTFVDSSSNNFTITRNGNTTQGSFSPFGWQWSNYFDGTGDFLTFPGITLSGDFCCECWYYRTANSTNYSVIFGGSSVSGANNNQFYVTNTGGLSFALSATGIINNAGTAFVNNTWNHLAYVRNGTNCAVFVNGVRQGTGTSSIATSVCSRIGDIAGLAGYQPIGNISNARIVSGSSVYDPTQTTLTVPANPLTAITNTKLLTCQSNRFVDNSSNAFAITRNGDVAVSNFAPFPAGEYATSVEGGSGYFDGNGDNLTAADNAAFEFGSGSFSIDCWVYISSLKGYQSFVSKPGATDGNGWNLYLESNNAFRFIAGTGGSWTINIGPTVAVPAQWYHVCITRDTSNQWRLFLNGKLDATTNNSFSQPDLAYPLYVGKYPNFPSYSSAKDFGGYMSSLRIVKGGMPSLFDTSTTTVGTQVFTPPTGPYTGSESLTAGSVSLLMNFTNGSIVDATGKNNLETVGNAQISTTVKKYGTGSLAFDGTGDALLIPKSSLFDFGTGDFTIEAWVYPTATGAKVIVDARSSDNLGAYGFSITSTEKLDFIYSSSRVTSSGSISQNTWTHVAAVRSSGTIKLYINGTEDGSASFSSAINANQSPAVGGGRSTGGSSITGYYFNGYIDDLRITKAARYTANFTPPTKSLPTK